MMGKSPLFFFKLQAIFRQSHQLSRKAWRRD